MVVAAYNGERHLAETLKALAAQIYRPVEVIIVDDGSTDRTASIARQHLPNSLIIQRENGGVSSARNAGAAAAQGRFVSFLDQDDIWAPEHLLLQMKAIKDRPDCGVVVSPYQHWYPAGEDAAALALARGPSQPLATDPDFTGWVFHQFLRDCWALTSATTIRLDLFRSVGGFNEQLPYAEDWDLWLRLARTAQFVKVCWPPVLYRQHPDQGSRVARPVDHRTQLLLNAAQTHGLASRDGRSISQRDFNRLIARYQMEFGRHQLQFGQRRLAIAALLQAWWRGPLQWRTLVWAVLAALGYRPKS